MNQDVWTGHWRQVRGKLREQWGRLTDHDLDVIEGRRDQLVGRLQERYGYSRGEAEREADAFRDRWLGTRRDDRPWERDPRAWDDAPLAAGDPRERGWRADPRERDWRERERLARERDERARRELEDRDRHLRDERERRMRESDDHPHRYGREYDRDRAFFGGPNRGDDRVARGREPYPERDDVRVRDLQFRLDEERRRRRELEDRLESERRARRADDRRYDERDYL